MGEARRRYAFRDGVARDLISQDDLLIKVVSQDVERILEEIHYLREVSPKHSTNKHAAKIPVPIYEDLKRRGIIDDKDAFRRWLNSSEASPWRVWQGWL
jgi:hypothetical protein